MFSLKGLFQLKLPVMLGNPPDLCHVKDTYRLGKRRWMILYPKPVLKFLKELHTISIYFTRHTTELIAGYNQNVIDN